MLKTLLQLYITFFKIGSITFGGGLAMLPILEKELVELRQWVSNEEILDYYAIGQSTPGIIAVNVATFIGHKKKGIIGGIAATLGMVSPSLIIITIIAKFISNFETIIIVQKALKGINIAVAALLTYSVIGLIKKTWKNWYSPVVFAAAFCSIYFFRCNSAFVILTAIAAGILLYVFSRRFSK